MNPSAIKPRLEPDVGLCSLLGRTPVRVGKLIARRSDGETYEAESADGPVALHLLGNAVSRSLSSGLTDQIESGPPDENFSWPQDLVDVKLGAEWVGCVTACRPAGFVVAREIVADPARNNLRLMSHAGRNLAYAFRRLNQLGYSFADFAPGDLLIDPSSGQVRIEAFENIVIDRDPVSLTGKYPRFLAPEIARGEALPSEETDRHILAAALFILLFAAHPLEGKELRSIKPDLAQARQIYGRAPRFIFDPSRPAPAADPSGRSARLWPLIPEAVRYDFEHTFGPGLEEPAERLPADDWGVAMTVMHDSLFSCGACRGLNAFSPKMVSADGKFAARCAVCGKPLVSPLRMEIAERTVILEIDQRLYPIHLSAANTGFAKPSARVIRVLESPGSLALQNETSSPWRQSDPPGAGQAVKPGKAAPLTPSTKIDFGIRVGVVAA